MEHVCARLMELAHTQGDRSALVQPDGRSVSFAELWERTRRLAGALAGLGLEPGHRVVLLLPMGIALYEALLALLWGGHTAVLVDPSAGLPRMERALGLIGVQGLIATPRAHWLRLVLPPLRGGRLYLSHGWTPLPARRLSHLDADPIDLAHPPAAEPALVTFTTGTTGPPKAIGRAHAFLMAQHRVLRDHMGLSSSDVDLPTLPIFLLNSLGAGATCVLPDGDLRDVSELDPAKIRSQVRHRGITTTSGSPAFFRPLVDHLLERGEQLPGVRRLFVGGARVPLGLLRDLPRAFPAADVKVVYGSTEAEPISTVRGEEALEAAEARPLAGSCVGQPVPGIQVRIAHPGSRVQAPDQGEIWVSGPHVNTGYYRGGSDENKVVEGSVTWHRTGDAGWLDDDGRLWLVGRIGDEVGGRYPFPVEARAERLPGVTAAALVEVDGEPVLAVVGAADLDEVSSATGITRVSRLDRLPVDPRHRAKVDRGQLAATLAAR